MICCVLHAQVHTATALPPPLPLIVGAQQLKGTGTSLFNAAPYIPTRQSRSGRRTTPAVTFHLVYTNSSQLNTSSSNIKTRNDTSDAKSTAILLTDIHDKIILSVIKLHCTFKKKVPDDDVTLYYRA